MSALTTHDVGAIMRRLNAEYQPPGRCAATPRRMRALLDVLQRYTDDVQRARTKYKDLGVATTAVSPVGGAVVRILGGTDVNVPQWRSDMANWQYRLGEYYRALDEAAPADDDTSEGCAKIYSTVTAPLLDGIWYSPMPGIVLSSEEKVRMATATGHPSTDVATPDHPEGHTNPKIPDAMMPFTLGNQIIVYQDFQSENVQRLFDDLLEGLPSIPPLADWPWWTKAALLTVGGLAVAGAGFYAYRWTRTLRALPGAR